MKRWLTILLLIFTTLAFAEKRAVVIGIGAYPDVDYGWHTIHGDNDVPLVIDMLLANGFQRANISTLTNQEASFSGIHQALQKLVRQAKNGDVVYIHFSGHGQLITDMDGDEPDGWDEAWIPYDALQEPTETYHGERHLLDDELNQYLLQLRAKVGENGKVIVVSDACHSGTSTRDITDESIIRGSSAKFILAAQPKPYTVARPIQWIAISACADKECNRQTKTPDGQPYGSLTYALYLLRYELQSLTADQLSLRLRQQLQPPFISRPQTPQVEYIGNAHQTLLQ